MSTPDQFETGIGDLEAAYDPTDIFDVAELHPLLLQPELGHRYMIRDELMREDIDRTAFDTLTHQEQALLIGIRMSAYNEHIVNVSGTNFTPWVYTKIVSASGYEADVAVQADSFARTYINQAFSHTDQPLDELAEFFSRGLAAGEDYRDDGEYYRNYLHGNTE